MNLSELDKMLDNIIKTVPGKKRELLEEVGDILEQQVKFNIAERVEPKSGNLGKGVEKVFGSKNGYVAIKPNYGIAPHTQLVEKGHRIVKNGINTGKFAKGKFMYRDSIQQCEGDILAAANRMVKEVVKENG